jgi:hypothetical protein
MPVSFQKDVSQGMSVTCDAKLVGWLDGDATITFVRWSNFHTYGHSPTLERMVPALGLGVTERNQDG